MLSLNDSRTNEAGAWNERSYIDNPKMAGRNGDPMTTFRTNEYGTFLKCFCRNNLKMAGWDGSMRLAFWHDDRISMKDNVHYNRRYNTDRGRMQEGMDTKHTNDMNGIQYGTWFLFDRRKWIQYKFSWHIMLRSYDNFNLHSGPQCGEYNFKVGNRKVSVMINRNS